MRHARGGARTADRLPGGPRVDRGPPHGAARLPGAGALQLGRSGRGDGRAARVQDGRRQQRRGADAGALAFRWQIFALAGDPSHPDAAKRGNVKGDAFGSPDGLYFDQRGVLWIETDVSTSVLNQGDYARLGNNQMLAADVSTGEIRRFLTGPSGCEITGCVMAPDGRSLFIDIQHPGETASERTDPASPRGVSNWPDYRADGRPRSATVVIRREDGGIVGT